MNRYIIWGIGYQGTVIYELFKGHVIVEAFIDQNPDLVGTTYKGIKIISFEDYLEFNDKLPIIVSPKYNDDIINLLKDNGIENYVLGSDLLNYLNDFSKNNKSVVLKPEYQFILEQINDLYKKLLNDYFYFRYLGYSELMHNKKVDNFLDCLNAKYPAMFIKSFDASICKVYKIILNKMDNPIVVDLPDNADLLLVHGIHVDFLMESIMMRAEMKGIPKIFAEDGFIRSIVPPKLSKVNLKYKESHSAILDDKGIYINANRESRMESILNSELFLTENEKKRALSLINLIRRNKISKYNHQPILSLNIGNPKKKKILVIDQVYNDASIEFGWANEETFSNMLISAINENLDSDILVKTHPVGNVTKGYFTDMEVKDNIYKIDFPINPISLIEQVDKVYVCTSQMGFEALMCGKEVHVFGMPFYAGWGASIDRQKCSRRIKKRSVEEIFYVAYVMCTIYVSYKTNSVCEIEQAIDEILELREHYCYSEKLE